VSTATCHQVQRHDKCSRTVEVRAALLLCVNFRLFKKGDVPSLSSSRPLLCHDRQRAKPEVQKIHKNIMTKPHSCSVENWCGTEVMMMAEVQEDMVFCERREEWSEEVGQLVCTLINAQDVSSARSVLRVQGGWGGRAKR